MTQVLQSIPHCLLLIPVPISVHDSGSKNYALILNFQLNHKLPVPAPFSFSPTAHLPPPPHPLKKKPTTPQKNLKGKDILLFLYLQEAVVIKAGKVCIITPFRANLV